MFNVRFLFLLIFLSACNVVKVNSNFTTRKVTRNAIKNYDYSTPDFQVNYWKGGEGPVIVLLHGFAGNAQLTWKNELLALAKTHTVIAPDLLWFGKSKATLAPNLNNQTIAIKQLLNHLKIDTFSVIGQSYGGFLALNLALNNPTFIRQLCIANSPGNTFNKEELTAVAKKNNVENVSDLFIFKDAKYLQRLYDLAAYKKHNLPGFLAKQLYNTYFNQHHLALIALMNSLQQEEISVAKNSALWPIKSLVIWGENDEIFSLKEGGKFAASIHADFHSIKNCGHGAQLDQPKLFTNAIVDFFNH
jgi:pimeloyl-ACP methyl ester carboxylesterase